MAALRFLVRLASLAGLLAVVLGFGGPLLFDLDLLAHFRPHLLGMSLLLIPLAVFGGVRGALLFAVPAAALAAIGLAPMLDRPGPAGHGVPVTVMTANLFFHNQRPHEMRQALLAADADILLTVETARDIVGGRDSLWDRYPYRALYENATPDLRVVLWSRLPVRMIQLTPLRGRNRIPYSVAAVVDVADGVELALIGLHLPHVAFGRQEREVERLEALAAALPRPLVVMGDLNATSWSWSVRRIARLTGTHRIGGILRTWRGEYPTPLGPVPEPIGLPIDHVMTSPGIGVERITTVPIPGSDHLAVRAVLRVPDQGVSSAADGGPVSSGG